MEIPLVWGNFWDNFRDDFLDSDSKYLIDAEKNRALGFEVAPILLFWYGPKLFGLLNVEGLGIIFFFY